MGTGTAHQPALATDLNGLCRAGNLQPGRCFKSKHLTVDVGAATADQNHIFAVGPDCDGLMVIVEQGCTPPTKTIPSKAAALRRGTLLATYFLDVSIKMNRHLRL